MSEEGGGRLTSGDRLLLEPLTEGLDEAHLPLPILPLPAATLVPNEADDAPTPAERTPSPSSLAPPAFETTPGTAAEPRLPDLSLLPVGPPLPPPSAELNPRAGSFPAKTEVPLPSPSEEEEG